MRTNQPITAKIIDFHVSESLCICGHSLGSHKFGMCYGNFMSCKCEDFKQNENEASFRVRELLADNTWVDTE